MLFVRRSDLSAGLRRLSGVKLELRHTTTAPSREQLGQKLKSSCSEVGKVEV